jgi:hypothetical protein
MSVVSDFGRSPLDHSSTRLACNDDTLTGLPRDCALMFRPPRFKLWAMLYKMLRPGDDDQILIPIIRPFAVQVMHVLIGSQESPQPLFNDQAMFIDIPVRLSRRMCRGVDQDVPINVPFSRRGHGSLRAIYRIRAGARAVQPMPWRNVAPRRKDLAALGTRAWLSVASFLHTLSYPTTPLRRMAQLADPSW